MRTSYARITQTQYRGGGQTGFSDEIQTPKLVQNRVALQRLRQGRLHPVLVDIMRIFNVMKPAGQSLDTNEWEDSLLRKAKSRIKVAEKETLSRVKSTWTELVDFMKKETLLIR